MNNKGTTLIEILISVVLISVIMVFMFNILVDLKNEETLSTQKSNDTLNRSSIIHLIQNDMISKELSSVTFCQDSTDNCDENHLYFTFTYKDNTKKVLKVYTKYLVYDDEIWNLDNGKYLLSDMTYCFKNDAKSDDTSEAVTSPYYFLNINIPVTHDATSKRKYDIDIINIRSDSTVLIPQSITYLNKTYSCQ